MVRLARLMIGDVEVAHEVVHDAFLAVHQRWDRLDEPAAYLRVCVVNRCRNVLRGRQRAAAGVARAALGASDLYVMVPGDPSGVEQALARLPERQRIALVLRYYEDLPVEQVATVLGCRRGAAASLINRAMSQLREVLS